MKKLRSLPLLLLLLLASSGYAYTFGQNKVNLEPTDWSLLETMHFDIYFPRGEDDFGRTVALMAEETYYLLREELTYPAQSRIPIIFYGSKTEFQNTNIIYPLLSEGVGGFTESLRNRVVIPFDGSYANLEELLVHELTHAYVNALDNRLNNTVNYLRPTSFPFWFSEGLPEYLSIGGEDDYNNMFILDMVVNDKLPELGISSGYYAYRLGESFLSYIAKNLGREKVSEFYFALRALRVLDDATKKVFGMEFEELETRWRYQLKRDYYPFVNTHAIPAESMEQRTQSEKDGSYFNYTPRFSPDGNRYVYYSSAGARYSIWLGGLHGLSKPDKVLTGEATGRVEEFYYFRSNLSWFPDSRRVAFSAKTANGDRIHILDVDREKIVQTLSPGKFDAIYEVDVAPDGGSIAFAGQRGMQCDLYLYDLGSGELRQLTDDLYNDAQPRFTPDGGRLLFTSERSRDESSGRKGFFANLTSNVFSLDLASQELLQHTFEKRDCSFPLLDAATGNLFFITAEDGISNLFALAGEGSGKAKVTDVLSGAYAADISPDGQHLLLANYFDSAWNIYYSPLQADSLAFAAYPAATGADTTDRLMDSVDLSQLDFFGKRERLRPLRRNPAAAYDTRRPLLGEVPGFEFTSEDSLQLGRDFSYDERPQKVGAIPQIQPYRTKFSLDSIWGGLAYSSSVGTIGYVELSLSDQMGNHGIGASVSVAGKLAESNILLTYLRLKHRIDYGIGVYNLFDESYYRIFPDQYDYWRYRERQTGLYFLLRYPLSRFLRAETDQMVYQRGQYLAIGNSQSNIWTEDEDIGQDIVYSPGLTLVHDNALYGSTGPLVGWRGIYKVNATLAGGKLDYVTNYLDLRSYTLFSKTYALAFRTIAGISSGDNPQHFDLGGYYGVRAYGGYLTGSKKAVASAELRFPFFEYIQMAFPVPLGIPNVRGSLFADLGTVFDEFSDFRGMNQGKLQDLRFCYGFGPRLDLGYVVLRLDIAWLSDLASTSKPTYFLSLSEDF